jgi:hypothetical protein
MDDKTKKYLDAHFARIDDQFTQIRGEVRGDIQQVRQEMQLGFETTDHNLSVVLELLESEDNDLKDQVNDQEKRIKNLEKSRVVAHSIRK